MIDEVYKNYKEYRHMLSERYDDAPEAIQNTITEIKLAMHILDEKQPEYKERYEREIQMQSSLTEEQKDFICWQIGEWYVEWKHKLISDAKNGTHRLGYAKELLKNMICGD